MKAFWEGRHRLVGGAAQAVGRLADLCVARLDFGLRKQFRLQDVDIEHFLDFAFVLRLKVILGRCRELQVLIHEYFVAARNGLVAGDICGCFERALLRGSSCILEMTRLSRGAARRARISVID